MFLYMVFLQICKLFTQTYIMPSYTYACSELSVGRTSCLSLSLYLGVMSLGDHEGRNSATQSYFLEQ